MLTVTDLKTLVLPLDPYRVLGDNASLHARAYEQLLLRCMRRFGFHQVPAGPPAGTPAVQGHERRYGLVDEQHAKTLGYHPPGSVGQEKPPPTEPPLPPEWSAVANGTVASTSDGQKVPSGGCGGEANQALRAGAPEIDDGLADRLDGESSQRTKQDSRVQAASAAWSACMRRAGHDYRSPLDVFDDDEWWSGTAPKPREIAVATADVACKKEVDLVNIWVSVHVAYQKRIMERHAEALATVKQHREIVQRNAVAAVNGG